MEMGDYGNKIIPITSQMKFRLFLVLFNTPQNFLVFYAYGLQQGR